MPLKIELKPHESIIIGESIITNDGERTRFYIEGNVPILREKFILREAEANTPSKRIYFVVQQIFPKVLPNCRSFISNMSATCKTPRRV